MLSNCRFGLVRLAVTYERPGQAFCRQKKRASFRGKARPFLEGGGSFRSDSYQAARRCSATIAAGTTGRLMLDPGPPRGG